MNYKTPKVSVVIPCYNHENFIEDAIEGVLNQTYQDFELIVCDNGSTDGSAEIIKKYDDIIKIISLKENNPPLAQELLYKNAKGEYIAWLASDDYWYPEKLEEQMKVAEEHKEINIFFTWSEVVDASLNNVLDAKRYAQKNRSRYDWIRECIIHSVIIEASSILIKNDGRLPKYQSDTYRFFQSPDLKLYLNMVMEEEIYIVEKYLVKHRMHGNNVSANTPEKQICAINERAYIMYETWTRLSDLDFIKIFFGDVGEFECTAEVTALRMILFLKLASEINGAGSYALAYAWEHYYDSGVSDILTQKYNFSLNQLYSYAQRLGEASEWYKNYLNEQEQMKNTELEEASIVDRLMSCNNKIIECAENDNLRTELWKVAIMVTEALDSMNYNSSNYRKCKEILVLIEKQGLQDDLWFGLVEGIKGLNYELKQ